MSQNDDTIDNASRLLVHLPAQSLAAELVRAYREPGEVSPVERLKDVLAARLDEERARLDGASD